MGELNKGFYVTAVLAVVALIVVCFWMLPYGQCRVRCSAA